MSNHRKPAAFAKPVGRLVMPPVAGMVACAILWAVAGGCAGGQVTAGGRMTTAGQVTHLRNVAEFKQVVPEGDMPVLVDFYKGGCPTCIPVDGLMDKLAEEYRGRAIVAKFMLMQPYFAVTSPELKDRYAISFFPTVILFVHGRETWRFVRRYELDEYRKALNEALSVRTAQRTSPGRGKPLAK